MIKHASSFQFYILQGNIYAPDLLTDWRRILGLIQLPVLHLSDIPCTHMI